jgi:hypothetical protein
LCNCVNNIYSLSKEWISHSFIQYFVNLISRRSFHFFFHEGHERHWTPTIILVFASVTFIVLSSLKPTWFFTVCFLNAGYTWRRMEIQGRGLRHEAALRFLAKWPHVCYLSHGSHGSLTDKAARCRRQMTMSRDEWTSRKHDIRFQTGIGIV